MTRRCKTFGNVIGEEGNSSHRPEYVTQNVARQRKPQKLSFGDASQVTQDHSMAEENGGMTIRAIEREHRHQVFGGNATGKGVTMRHGYGFVVTMSNMCRMYVHIL
ncbi:hypothetical protein GOP47_0001423 [Adiantum capillus-veneris]|uniref:Uncharacterized protein n=1 Tax=Adiantum capillus-veneris TaxID=13818 RepID=A0A9D4V909_ADICA|nr:hypothetical protein GOP47_0001423 [Adiantum capillus-veneris]